MLQDSAPSLELTAPEWSAAERLIHVALEEDLGSSFDVTTNFLVPEKAQGTVQVVSRQHGVLSGAPIAARVFSMLDPNVEWESLLEDGSKLAPGLVVARISGSMRSLLTGERTALNMLTMLSGVASRTREFVDRIAGTNASILDTRKTLPGIRALQKYAVRCGGGMNHRIGLFDAILVKDNHLAWFTDAGHALNEVVPHLRMQAPPGMTIEIEVDSLDQLNALLPTGPDIVLLDNMLPHDLQAAVAMRDEMNRDVQLEASGGITLETVADIAQTGIDRISIGGLTHSAPALDLGFDWVD